jgi:uncharacterized protein YjgD (DUF1641 family)
MDTPMTSLPEALPLQQLGLAASHALNDGMVERLVTTAAHGIEVLDHLNNEDTRAAIHRAIEGLTILHTTGALDAVFELAQVLQAARSALTDQMIERLNHFMEVLVNNLATQEIAEFARDAELSLYDAARLCEGPEAPKGLWGVVRSLSKPETIHTLNLLVAFGNCLTERMKGFQGRLEPDTTE